MKDTSGETIFVDKYKLRIRTWRHSLNPIGITTQQMYRIMHELPWITIFWPRVRWFASDFHEWQSHEWKSLANHITRGRKIVINGNSCIISFLTRYFIFWTHDTAHFVIVAKNGLFWLSIVTSPQLIYDVTQTSIATSYSSIVFARANWRKGDLH